MSKFVTLPPSTPGSPTVQQIWQAIFPKPPSYHLRHMIQLIQNSGQGMTTFKGRLERVDILTVATRMFNEGYTKSTILRLTSITADDFMKVVREGQASAPSLL